LRLDHRKPCFSKLVYLPSDRETRLELAFDLDEHDIGGVLFGLVDDEYGVLAGGHFGGGFGDVQVHRLGVAGGQDERGSLAIAGADSPEDVGGSGALIVRRRGPRSPSCPAPGDLVLLPDPGLVPEPDLYQVAIDPVVARDRVRRWGNVFAKASTAPAAWA
jgi:hypothetical protein